MKKTQKDRVLDVLTAFPNFKDTYRIYGTKLMNNITQADIDAVEQYDIDEQVLLICAANGIKYQLTNHPLFMPKSVGSKNMIGYDRNGEPIGQFTPDETLAVSKVVVCLNMMNIDDITLDVLNLIADLKGANKKFKKILE